MYLKDFHSGILKLFEGNFHQGIKLNIIYFSLTHINIRSVIILFSIHVRVLVLNHCGIPLSNLATLLHP